MRALAWPFGGGDRALWIAGHRALLRLPASSAWRCSTASPRRRSGDREAARRTVLYVAVFPFAYFFTQVYTESLFLLTSVSAVAAAVASRWGWAGALRRARRAHPPERHPDRRAARPPRPRRAPAASPSSPAARRRSPSCPWASAPSAPSPTGSPATPSAGCARRPSGATRVGNRPWVELMRLLDGLERHGLYGYFFSDPLAPYYFVHGVVALVVRRARPERLHPRGPRARRLRGGEPLRAAHRQRPRGHRPLRGDALPGVHAARARSRSRRVHEAILIGGALVLSLLTSLFAGFYPIY